MEGGENVPNKQQYEQLSNELRALHKEIMKMESAGTLARDAADTLMKLRLRISYLMRFKNEYIDIENEAMKNYANMRQEIYEAAILDGKSHSAAHDIARESTRKDEAAVQIAKNEVRKIANDYERYNPICMALQSLIKEQSSERAMG